MLCSTAASTLRVDARLEVGQVSETVEVRTDIAQVQTENAKVTTAVQNKLVDELPLVVGGALRSPFDLVTITPEARGSGGQLVARRRPGRGLERDARWRLGRHQPLGRRRRDRLQRAVARSHHRVHRRHQRLQGRVRAGRRRHDDVRLEIRHEPVPRRRPTTSCATRSSTRAASLRHDQRRLPSERFRRHRRRSRSGSQNLQRPQPDVLLLLL